MKNRNILIGLIAIVIAIIVFVFVPWCSGTCEVIECGPNDPCNINGKQYITGNRCANEGAVCDDGIIWDCHCVTKIIGVGQNVKPDCDCD